MIEDRAFPWGVTPLARSLRSSVNSLRLAIYFVTASREGKKLLKEQANDLSLPSTLLPEKSPGGRKGTHASDSENNLFP